MEEGEKLPPRLVEAYGKVLEELRRGVQMKDDTYLAHLVDATLDIVRNVGHLRQLHLLPLLEGSLASPGKTHTRPFLLRLATHLVQKLPDVAPMFNANLNLPCLLGGLGEEDNYEEDEALCPTLHLLAALIERKEVVEAVWEQLLFPLANAYSSLPIYTQRALVDLFSSYLVTTLSLGMSRMRPKGSELVARLESEVGGLFTWSKNVGKVDKVVDLLSRVIKKAEDNGEREFETLREFLCPLLNTHLPLDPLLCPESWPHPPAHSLVRLLISCHPREVALPYISLLLASPTGTTDATTLSLKKLALRLAADRPPLLGSVLPAMLSGISDSEETFSDKSSVLLLHILSLYKVDTAVKQFVSCPGAVQLLFTQIKKLADDPASCQQGQIVTACCFFLRRMVTMNLLTSDQSAHLVIPILSTVSMRLSASESLRVSLLNLLSTILTSLPHLSPTITPLPTLCTLAMDSSYWSVQDSALSSISSLLSSSSLSPLVMSSLSLLTSTISTLLTAPNIRYVRASAVKTLKNLATSPTSLLNPLEILNLLPFFSLKGKKTIRLDIDPAIFFEDYDEIFRRELVHLITAIYKQLLEKSNKGNLTDVEKKGIELVEALAILMLKKEQDWEVKLLTADFWRLSLASSPLSSAWMTGVKTGCEDYESSVNSQFRKMMKEVGGCLELKARCKIIIESRVQSAHSLKRVIEEDGERPAKNTRLDGAVGLSQKKEEPENVDDEEVERIQTIEDILEEPHKLLLKDLVSQESERQAKGWPRKANKRDLALKSCWIEELPIIDSEDFLYWLNQFEEDEKMFHESGVENGGECVTRLMGVLEDILHSTSVASMNDLIDCY